jgi:hypothetical protein
MSQDDINALREKRMEEMIEDRKRNLEQNIKPEPEAATTEEPEPRAEKELKEEEVAEVVSPEPPSSDEAPAEKAETSQEESEEEPIKEPEEDSEAVSQEVVETDEEVESLAEQETISESEIEETAPTEEEEPITTEEESPETAEVERNLSFSDWLKRISSDQTKETRAEKDSEENKSEEAESEEPRAEIAEKIDLLDSFVEKLPELKKQSRSQTPSPKAKQTAPEDAESEGAGGLVTETLAKVYIRQKHYKKAIQAYEILMLKYPEKSSFFASQISEIKKLENSK